MIKLTLIMIMEFLTALAELSCQEDNLLALSAKDYYFSIGKPVPSLLMELKRRRQTN